MFIQVTDEIREIFLDRIKTLLEHGETTQIVKTSSKKTVKFLIDEDNQEVPVEVVRTVNTDKQTTLNPTPNWVLELVAKSMSDESAIDHLVRQGYLVINPAVAIEKDSEQSKGLSEFAVQEIRSKLLGIDNGE